MASDNYKQNYRLHLPNASDIRKCPNILSQISFIMSLTEKKIFQGPERSSFLCLLDMVTDMYYLVHWNEKGVQ